MNAVVFSICIYEGKYNYLLQWLDHILFKTNVLVAVRWFLWCFIYTSAMNNYPIIIVNECIEITEHHKKM